MVSGNIMDQRLLRLRRKTIKELKPDYWWDANSGIGVADNALVPAWVDKISGVSIANANASYQPRFLEWGIGGYPAVLFSLHWLSCDIPAALEAATIGTVVAVVEATDSVDAQAFLGVQNTGDANQTIYFGTTATTGTPRLTYRNAAVLGGCFGNTGVGVTRRVLAYGNDAAGGDWVLHVDNVLQTLDTAGFSEGNTGTWCGDLTGLDKLVIGARTVTGSSPCHMKIAHIIIWNSIL